jgi:hypothetical protein
VKTLLTTFFVLFLAAAVQAQNCCVLVPGAGGMSYQQVVVSGPQGGSYKTNVTWTSTLQCNNTNNTPPTACGSAPPANVVGPDSGAGDYSTVLGKWVECSPVFHRGTVNPDDQANGGEATWNNTSDQFTGVSGLNGQCIMSTSHPSYFSWCPFISCPSGGGGGGGGCSVVTITPAAFSQKPRIPTANICPAKKMVCPVCDPGCGSPILIDVTGNGFSLTSDVNGVMFDIRGSGHPVKMAWTAKGAMDAFLALPGPDGLVHNGKELFGNFTPQPPSDTPNGFAALAVYDQPANGGNGDGVIDSQDGVWNSLRLWIDANHDGICTKDELHTLPSMGINSLSLKYREDMKTDQYGNLFRYRAAVNPDDPDEAKVGRTAYDVFFVIQTGTTSLVELLVPELFPPAEPVVITN